MTVTIEPFVTRLHLSKTVEALFNVTQVDVTYPPAQDAERTQESLTAWLESEPCLSRWVALVDGEVAGHVMVSKAHEYLTSFLDNAGYQALTDESVSEIGKFFVDPGFQRRGVGEALFREALAFSWSEGMQPALAVVSTGAKAVEFYHHHGMKRLGSFDGIHGENQVFVHETRP